MEMFKYCKKCNSEKTYSEFSKNKKLKDGFQAYCKSCFAQNAKIDYAKNREKYIETSKKFYKNSKKKHKESTIRFRTSPYGKLTTQLKGNINDILKHNGDTYSETIGCTGKELKKHLERQFADGMSWENRGIVWYTGFVRRPKEFLTDDVNSVREAFKYTNLRPVKFNR